MYDEIRKPIDIYGSKERYPPDVGHIRNQEVHERPKRLELDYERQHVKDLGNMMTKIDNLGEELRAKKKLIAELETEREQLLPYKEQYLIMKTNYEKEKMEIKRLNLECEKIKHELNEVTKKKYSELEKMKRNVGDLEQRVMTEKTARKTDEERMYEIIENLTNKNKMLINSLNEEKLEREKLVKKVNDQTNQYKLNRQKFEETIDDAKKREIELNSIIDKARESIKDIEMENNELRKNLNICIDEREQLKNLLENEKRENERILEKLATKHKECEGLYTEREGTKNNCESFRKDLNNANAVIEKQSKIISMMRSTVNDDKRIIKSQEDDNGQLQAQLIELKRSHEELFGKLEKENDISTQLKKRVEELEGIKCEMEIQIRDMKEEQIRLNSELSAFSNARQELANARIKEIDLLNKAVANAYGMP